MVFNAPNAVLPVKTGSFVLYEVVINFQSIKQVSKISSIISFDKLTIFQRKQLLKLRYDKFYFYPLIYTYQLMMP